MGTVTILMRVPAISDLSQIAAELSTWQRDRGPFHVHPGDLGWHSTVGARKTTADLRVWSRKGKMVALGLLDGEGLLRMAVDPEVHDDDDLARQVARDVNGADAGIPAVGEAIIEARGANSLRHRLLHEGWVADEPWTPFRLDLARPVSDERVKRARIRVEAVDPGMAESWVAVHWSAFKGTPMGEEDSQRFVERWTTMAEGPFSDLARHLIALDAHDNAVAVTTVWSAGAGRPGLIEPMGVHRDHRGHGYGVAITLAGARALQEMGASSAVVVAENANVGAVATYASSGFTAHDPVTDLKRSA
jgi:GNAT superfamily N-acetyltransferase